MTGCWLDREGISHGKAGGHNFSFPRFRCTIEEDNLVLDGGCPAKETYAFFGPRLPWKNDVMRAVHASSITPPCHFVAPWRAGSPGRS